MKILVIVVENYSWEFFYGGCLSANKKGGGGGAFHQNLKSLICNSGNVMCISAISIFSMSFVCVTDKDLCQHCNKVVPLGLEHTSL